ncbi:MAG TPA: hypothetical protein VMK13_17700 [Streptosporangiaceae bacterium]|nr:hypothetical protein [Streptosporangiaceae bacterium]
MTFTRLDRSGARAERSTVASVFTDAYAAAIASGGPVRNYFLLNVGVPVSSHAHDRDDGDD